MTETAGETPRSASVASPAGGPTAAVASAPSGVWAGTPESAERRSVRRSLSQDFSLCSVSVERRSPDTEKSSLEMHSPMSQESPESKQELSQKHERAYSQDVSYGTGNMKGIGRSVDDSTGHGDMDWDHGMSSKSPFAGYQPESTLTSSSREQESTGGSGDSHDFAK